MLVYKICTRKVWEASEKAGSFVGMPIDHRDGYIHLSTMEQCGATIRKYFRGQADLRMLAIDADALGDNLRWENSSTGRRGSFPHLYGAFPLSAIVEVSPIDAPE